MIALPAATPVTTPLVALTEAIDGLLLLHVPPVLPLLPNDVESPAQRVEAPVTTPAFGTGFTVIAAEVEAVAHAETTV